MADGSVAVSMFTDEAPQSLGFRWNDGPVLDLDDAMVTLSNSWYETSVTVPAALVDDSLFGSTNRMEYVIGLSQRDVGTTLSLKIEP